MPDKTDQHIANPEPKQVIRATVAADGTITVPNCEGHLVSVDIADVDLLLGFADGTYVIIPNGALEALDDIVHRVVFTDNANMDLDQAHFSADHHSSLEDLFKMVGIADLANAGSLRVVTEHVDSQGSEQSTLSDGEDILPADPAVDALIAQLHSGSGTGAAAIPSSSSSLEPIPIDEPPPSILPRPSVYSPGQKIESVAPDVRLDPNITADDIINIAESDPAHLVTITGSARGSVVVGDTVLIEIGNYSTTTQVLDDFTFSVDIPGDVFVTNIDGSLMTVDGLGSPLAITATVTNSQGQVSSPDSEFYSIDNVAPQPVISLDPQIAGDNIVNVQESQGDVVLTGNVALLTSSANVTLAGDTVTIMVGGQPFQGFVNPDGATFSVSVPGSVLATSSGSLDVRIDTVDTAGNAASAEQTGIGFGIDVDPPLATIQLDPLIAGDGVVNLAESRSNVTISGTVGGDVQVGDEVTLTVYGHDSVGTVYNAGDLNGDGVDDLRFDISIVGSELRAAAEGSPTLEGTVSAAVETFDAAGNSGVASTDALYTLDVTPPTATIVVDDPALKLGETSQVTITFDAPVTGFDFNDDLTIENGVLSNITEVVTGESWTATLTPNAPVEDASNLITLHASGVTDAAGNAGVGEVNSNNYAIDTRPPVVESVTVDDTKLTDADAGNIFSVSVTFDEAMDTMIDPVLTFNPDPDVLNSSLTSTGGSWNLDGTIYTETYMVVDGNIDFDIVTIGVNGAQDASGNPHVDYVAEFEFEVDTLNPSVTIVDNNTDGVVSSEDRLVTFDLTFTEPVSNLTQADISIAGGDWYSFDGLSADGLTASFSILAFDESNIPMTVTVNDTVTDVNGNPLQLVNNSRTLIVDTLNPRCVINADVDIANGGDGVVSDNDSTVTYTLTFSKEVKPFTSADIGVTGGNFVAGSLSLAPDGLSATFKVEATQDKIGEVTVEAKTTIVDTFDRPLVLETHTLPLDTINPGVTITHNFASTEWLTDNNNVIEYTLEFTKEVADFTASDISVVGGTMNGDLVYDSATSIATFTVTANDASTANLIVSAKSSIVDLVGNALVPASGAAVKVDTLNPTADDESTGLSRITVENIGGTNVGGNVTIVVRFSESMDQSVFPTLTFSENLQGALVQTFQGWYLSGMQLLVSYKIVDTNIDFSNVTVDVNGGQDLHGNLLLDQSAFLDFSIDTLNPTVSFVTNSDGVVNDNDNVVSYTLTFSEPVQSLTATDLSITGGDLSIGPVLAADGLSATFSATAYNESTEPLVVTVESSVVDLHGNALVPGTYTLAVDTIDYFPDFDCKLYTSPDLKVTGGSGLPYGAYDPAGSDADHLLASSPEGQAWREQIVGDDLDNTIIHNSQFSVDASQWAKSMHVSFIVYDQVTSIELVLDPTIAGIPGFNILSPDLVRTSANTWLLTPSTLDPAAIAVNGLDLKIVYDVSSGAPSIDFNLQMIVNGIDNGVATTPVIKDFPMSWCEASTASDFNLFSGGTQVMVLPQDGIGVMIDAGDGADTVVAGAGHDIIYGRGGNDIIDAGSGDDLILGGAGADQIDGGVGVDTVSFSDSVEDVTVTLVAGSGSGSGGDAEGDSYVNVENFIGGSGNDTFIVDGMPHSLDGGAGIDTVSYENSIADIAASLLTGNGTFGDAAGDHYAGIENLTGGAGNDFLEGNAGNNVLHGGAGADALHGGAGFDTASYAHATSGVIAALDPGLADFQTGDAAGDSFDSIENLTGSDWNDSLYGNTLDNVLDGGAGDDRLYGSAGNDTFYANQGHDIAYGDIGNDTLHASVNASNLPTILNGGADTDTLVLHDMASLSGTYDFTALAGVDSRLESIEVLDIREGTDASRVDADSTIAITGQDILNMVDQGVGSELTVLADNGDALDLTAFAAAGEIYVENVIAPNHTEYVISDSGGTELARIQWHIA